VITKIDMDNGSFPIAKDSLRVLAKTKLSGAHRAMIDVIWMETYGWPDHDNKHEQKNKQRKTSARIPHQVFADETQTDKTFISHKLNDLVNWGVITRDKNTVPYTYSFNVHVDRWDPSIFRTKNDNQAINSLSDSQQLFKQTTVDQSDNSLLNDQLELIEQTTRVDQIDNCCSPQTPISQGLAAPLNNILNNSLNNIYIVVFDHWNKQGITVHRIINADIKRAIDAAVKKHGLELVQLGIERYSEIYRDPGYYFGHKWTLINFLKRKGGLPDFLDEGEKWVNYQEHKAKNHKPRAPDDHKPRSCIGEDAEIM